MVKHLAVKLLERDGLIWSRAKNNRNRYEQTLEIIADSDPLPPLPGTDWEEIMGLAAAMSEEADHFISGLMETHLVLAGSCAAQTDVAVSDGLKETLRNSLLHRSQNKQADLRARIAAGWPWENSAIPG